MNRLIFLIFIISIVFFSSCEKILMKPNPDTDNKSIFNEYATIIQEKYAMLEAKNVDIKYLRDSIEKIITDDLSEEELFNKLTIITARLRDGHTSLSIINEKHYSYDFYSTYPPGFSLFTLSNHYLIGSSMKSIEGGELGIKVAYGFLPQSTDIGYIWVPSWDIELTDDEIEMIFKEVKDAKGLILDMRQNTGGDPALSSKFAGYLTDKEVYLGYENFKHGPGANDFSKNKIYLKPANSENKFLKPVLVITDRLCFSATTTLLYSVKPLENVRTIGQRSGGGSGGFSDGYLANGWQYQLSTSEFIDYLGNHLDDGVDPDISVALDTTMKATDEVIERAISELSSN